MVELDPLVPAPEIDRDRRRDRAHKTDDKNENGGALDEGFLDRVVGISQRVDQFAEQLESAGADSALAQKLLDDVRPRDAAAGIGYAIRYGLHENIDRWLADLECPDDARGPLLMACDEGDASIVSKILKYGLAASFRTPYGGSPLKTAALGGHLDVVRCLLASGVSLVGKDAALARKWAAHAGHDAVLAALKS